jgi:capsular polysaccharide biosynthesis protein
MVLLRQCETGWGASRIVETNPSTSVYEGLFYLPFAPDQTWGLFNSSGDIIRDSVDFRDTQGETNAQLLTTDLTADSVDQFAPHAHYIYGGRIHLHYGHFIVNTLSRFWSIKNLFVPGSKVVCHGPGTVEDWFQFPFFVDSMAAIGLTADDFVMFQSPVRIDKVIIPRTSFEEQKSAHRVYKGFCADIGKTMYEPSEIDVAAQPIYFSKTRLSAGVGTFVNEIEFETVLKRKGVKVIYPETLSFREQVQLIARHRTITGTAGSFLHTSIFGPSRLQTQSRA